MSDAGEKARPPTQDEANVEAIAIHSTQDSTSNDGPRTDVTEPTGLFGHGKPITTAAESLGTQKPGSNPTGDHVESAVAATEISSNTTTRRPPKTNIGELYDEIEPEYKRLTQGDLDFNELDVNSLLTDWQSLKQADTRNSKSPDPHQDNLLQNSDTVQGSSAINQAVQNPTKQEDFAAPEILVTSARSKPKAAAVTSTPASQDSRPDAAKLEDLKRFAYAYGSKSSTSQKKTEQKSTPRQTTSDKPMNTEQRPSQPQPSVSKDTPVEAASKPPVDNNLSFSHASKVQKILGLKRDPLTSSSSQYFNSSARSSVDVDPTLAETEDDVLEPTDDSDEESFNTAHSKPIPSGEIPPVRRQVSFRRSPSSSSVTMAMEQTAKRALLIKAAHLEVCNHLIRTSRAREGVPQANNWSLVGLVGLSFWDRLTEIEKIKSQFTVIEIMRRYSHETQFTDAAIDQVLVRDGSFKSHESAMSLDPKTDLPLSTDIDNEVGRSKAAAEYIIEKLSAKLASSTFNDHEDNVFKVPIKDKSPLGRIESDAEWRLVQDAVGAHALGRGYQVQMGDGPEEITRPWQVRQKEDLKDALLSLKWPSANELIWIKVNRLGIEH